MNFKKFCDRQWYNGAVVICIGVAFYVLLSNLDFVLAQLFGFLKHFRSVIWGVAFAYILNPVAGFFYFRIFRKMKLGNVRWYLSVAIAVAAALLALALLIGTLIPQLMSSIGEFSENIDGYAASLLPTIKAMEAKYNMDLGEVETLSQNALSSISGFVRQNSGHILKMAANSGKGILSMVISLIVAIYLLIGKKRVLKAWWRLVRALCSRKTTEAIMEFTLRCDTILVSYMVHTLIDALIVGVINAIFMTICQMRYVGLVSIVVAVTNLIPTFGPVIGAGIGGFILLANNPVHAVMFVLFSIMLQFVDGYILKPKLFSNSLGVSGLLILVSVIVLGNMFGVLGMLLAIPVAAILNFIYNDYFLPARERRQEERRART